MDPIRIEKKLDFDLDSLFTPAPEDLPAEESPQGEAAYGRIQEARSQAAWAKVADLCVHDLRNGARDLQFAAWLTEAWLHLYGINGLAHGLEAIADLCEGDWDEHGAEDRLTSIGWVDGNLPAVVRILTHEPLLESALPTDTSFYEDLLHDLESAADTAAELEGVLNEHCSEQLPRLGELTNALDSIQEQISGILARRDVIDSTVPVVAEREPADAVAEPGAPAEAPIPSAPEGPPSAPGPIRSRADAYARLADAADFLARTDPHSPVPYLIRRAIAWGNMPLGDLVADLVRNDGERSGINRLLGVGKPEK